MRVVEIRSYRLQPGSRARFHALLGQQSLPLMAAAGIDVLAFGPSLLGDDDYYLIRAFADLADLQSSQEAFYASPAWRCGPRQAIIELIESDSNVVLQMSESAVEALRRPPIT